MCCTNFFPFPGTLTNNGGLDYYIVKYDPSGNVVWAKGATGLSNDVGYNITADASGNSYVVGSSNSASLTFGSTTLNQQGYDDIFVVKYDPNGNVLWAKSFGGPNDDIGEHIAVDANGNSFITGYFGSPNISFGASTVTNSGTNNIYLTKLDASGNVLWAKSAGGFSDDRSISVATDPSGNAIITGMFTSSSVTFGSTNLSNSGSDDYFLAKYDGSGNVLWAKGASGVSNDVGYNVTTDASGNPYVIGSFNSSSLTFGTTTLNLSSFDDLFLVKYDANGNVLWAKSAGGTGNDIGEAIVVDVAGSAYITGYFGSSSLSFGSTTLNNSGTNNIYVAKYDLNGNALWAESAGGSSDDRAACLALDVNGNAYIGGYFSSSTLNLGTNALTNQGGNDMYVGKLLSGSTGIFENPKASLTLTAFPNPSSGEFELLTKGLPNDVPSQMYITDVLGREVYKAYLQQQTNHYLIDLSEEGNGVYYIRLVQGPNEYAGKVVVSK